MNTIKMIRHGAGIAFRYCKKNAPTFLAIFGVGLMACATGKAIAETPEAKYQLDSIEDDDELTHKDYLKAKARIIFYHYWSTAAMMIGGAAFIFWGHHITLGQTAAAIAAYNMKSDELLQLEKKITDVDGTRHLEKIKDEILKDTVNSGPESESDIYDTGKGKMLCYEVISGRYFWSDVEKIRRAANDLNEEINSRGRYDETEVSLNEWYDYIGLERTALGNKLGWLNSHVELKLTSILNKDNVPCLAIGYRTPPTWEFDQPISDRGICSDDWCDRAPYVL